jgi:uncharacterized protein (TIGR02722 family)
MKKLILNVFLVGALAYLAPSCHSVKRIDTDSEIDISGKWNDVDSKLTAQALTEQVLGEIWLNKFVKEKGEKPVVIVGFVKNKSHEHIEAETFMKDIERSFITSQKVRLVQGGDKREEIRAERADQQTNASVSTMKKFGLEVGADFMMQGSINTIVDAYKRQKIVYYQVNLELSNIQTNEIVWIGEKKIKKYVKN